MSKILFMLLYTICFLGNFQIFVSQVETNSTGNTTEPTTPESNGTEPTTPKPNTTGGNTTETPEEENKSEFNLIRGEALSINATGYISFNLYGLAKESPIQNKVFKINSYLEDPNHVVPNEDIEIDCTQIGTTNNNNLISKTATFNCHKNKGEFIDSNFNLFFSDSDNQKSLKDASGQIDSQIKSDPISKNTIFKDNLDEVKSYSGTVVSAEMEGKCILEDDKVSLTFETILNTDPKNQLKKAIRAQEIKSEEGYLFLNCEADQTDYNLTVNCLPQDLPSGLTEEQNTISIWNFNLKNKENLLYVQSKNIHLYCKSPNAEKSGGISTGGIIGIIIGAIVVIVAIIAIIILVRQGSKNKALQDANTGGNPQNNSNSKM